MYRKSLLMYIGLATAGYIDYTNATPGVNSKCCSDAWSLCCESVASAFEQHPSMRAFKLADPIKRLHSPYVGIPVIALSDFKSLAGDVTCEPDIDGVTFYVVRSLIRLLIIASCISNQATKRGPTGLIRMSSASSGLPQKRHRYLCNATRSVRQSEALLFLSNLWTSWLLECK